MPATKKKKKKANASATATAAPSTGQAAEIVKIPYPDLLTRKDEIRARLDVIGIDHVVAANSKKKGAAAAAAAAAKRKAMVERQQQKKRGAFPDAEPSSSSAAAAVSSAAATTPPPAPPAEPVPRITKTDTHWDYVLKEMMWLGADFQSERKSQISSGRKLSMAVRQFHKSKESRRAREIAEFEVKRRRLAGKLARDVRGWWTKVERVIAYKQKVDADAERRKAMDQHLVFLVKQTERYGKSLAEKHADAAAGNDADETEDGIGGMMAIEEALKSADSSARQSRKQRIVNYSRVQVDASDSELYGTSTADDSDDYDPDESDVKRDDVTTLVEAERLGTREDELDEAKKLAEESEMDIELVLERLREEGAEAASEGEGTHEMEEQMLVVPDSPASRTRSSDGQRRVQFAPTPLTLGRSRRRRRAASSGTTAGDSAAPVVQEEEGTKPTVAAAASAAVAAAPALRPRRTYTPPGDGGSDADDDADASDVEDFVAAAAPGDDASDDGSDEFVAEGDAVDDETTLEAEERLGREMSPEDEIAMLKREGEMSVEELRTLYAPGAGAAEDHGDEEVGEQVEEDDVDEEVDDGGDSSGSEEFVADANAAVDDETTIEAEERLGRDVSYEDEIAMLKRENEMSVEELRAMYGQMDEGAMAESDDDAVVAASRSGASQEREGSKVSVGAGRATRSKRSTVPMAEPQAIASLDDDDNAPEDEFHPDNAAAVDDETTLEAEERLGRDMSYEDEIALLKRENEMSVDELRAMYAGMDDDADGTNDADHMEVDTKASTSKDVFDEDDGAEEDEFHPDAVTAVDDEATLEAEERLGREMSHEEEMAMLKRESETPIEELRAMYAKMENAGSGASDVESSSDTEPQPAKRLRKHDRGADVEAESDDAECNARKKAKASGDATDQDEEMDVLRALEVSEAKARHTMVSRPFLLSPWVHLREYQQIGLNWLVSIQARRLNGILADEMGLGKTLQTISLLSYLACYKGIWGPHLVIVPTSCIVNWETEIKRFCPGLKVLTYYGSAKRRKELRVGWTKSNWHHIVVTSYQLAVQDAFAFRRKRWYYLILDEAQNIKNFQSQRWQTLVNFNTQRRLLLTGTPLQNNLMELWSLLHFLMPHIFRSRKEFSYWFSNPMNNIIEGNTSRNDDLIGRLHGIIRPFVLRRLKKDVETQMPGKFEHIVKCQLSRRQMFLYEEFMARSSTRVALKRGGNYMGMMNVLMQLRKVCNHPDLFEPRTVITPFFMEPLTISTAGCVINATATSHDVASSCLVHPLWSPGCGMPDFSAASSYDKIIAKDLASRRTSSQTMLGRVSDTEIQEPKPDNVATPGLAKLLDEIWTAAKRERVETVQLQASINSWRCQSPAFPYPRRLIQSVSLEPSIPLETKFEDLSAARIASTPTELLGMRRSQQERADDLDEMMKKFVICIPKAGARRPVLGVSKVDAASQANEARLSLLLSEPLETHFRPFRKANARLTSFFPDKKLVQFDSGKLQTLATLMYDLKRGGHRVLIFTQMSKMLDILEAFLNLHGHTYLRLDGGTGVEKRQRLMDRFNNDSKVFCFILSTRSGGLGINLTGADTVIFYDSDWNPAMDAQAQDRAHRIGQTRDVHIYRLVTEHSIEENILVKAKQKRHLDFLVMDEGKFHATPAEGSESAKSSTKSDDKASSDADVFTKGGLRDILGVKDDDDDDDDDDEDAKQVVQAAPGDTEDKVSKEQMESTMASLEDEDDVNAMRGAQKEAEEELKEFDETVQIEKDDEGEDSPDEADGGEEKKSGSTKKTSTKAGARQKKAGSSKDAKAITSAEDSAAAAKAEDEIEKEFAAWQSKVGVDMAAINASLKPTERYGLRFREEIDPFYSVHFFSELQRMQQASTIEEEWNVEGIEEAKAAEEKRALEEGDLLATLPQPEILPRQRQLYVREKSRLRADRKRRKLTGENWGLRTDPDSDLTYWFNSDTGEALWDKPKVLIELEADELASKEKWNAFPSKPLVYVMSFLLPFPERMRCAEVCRQWHAAATDISFVLHALPVEMGALALDTSKLEHNHFRTIADALASALPGDTIELGDGHYWVNEPGLKIDMPLRIVGDEKDPSHVVIELSGTVTWDGVCGWMEGVTLRRPRISSDKAQPYEVLQVLNGAKFDMAHCVLDNEGSRGNVATLSVPSSKGVWKDVEIRGADRLSYGINVESSACVQLTKCRIINNHGDGICLRDKASMRMQGCTVKFNEGYGLKRIGAVNCQMEGSSITDNRRGDIVVEDDGSASGKIEESDEKNLHPIKANGAMKTENVAVGAQGILLE